MASVRFSDVVVISGEGRQTTDVVVEGDRIVAIGAAASRSVDQEVAGNGRLLMPGLIDDQVHFREPGLTHKADIAHESKAAVAGGITSFMEMPNTKPPALDAEAVEWKYSRAAEVSPANYAFYLGASNENLEAVRTIDATKVAGVKVFMGSSTGGMLVDDETVLRAVFAEAPCLIATHCEHEPTVRANEAAARERFGDDIPIGEHPVIRSHEACYASSSLAVGLAQETGARLHVLHLTTAKELELFQAGRSSDKRITCEACLHHLWFSDADYATHGSNIKCNPAIKTISDREALRQAVRDGVIDVLATDHAPHTREEKAQPGLAAPSGLPYAQQVIPLLGEFVHQGEFTWELIADRYAARVAELYDMRDRGRIVEGGFADLVLVDPNAVTEVDDAEVLSKCGWSPFHGQTLRSRVDLTMVSGNIVYRDGQVIDGVRGQRLSFDR